MQERDVRVHRADQGVGLELAGRDDDPASLDVILLAPVRQLVPRGEEQRVPGVSRAWIDSGR